jgi:hypothetical protein
MSKERLPFSVTYFCSLALTLYFSLGVRFFPQMSTFIHCLSQAHSQIGSLVCGVIQVLALISYVLAYFPGGTQTLRLGGSLALRGAGNLLPR